LVLVPAPALFYVCRYLEALGNDLAIHIGMGG
jgi:hypothetical protein